MISNGGTTSFAPTPMGGIDTPGKGPELRPAGADGAVTPGPDVVAAGGGAAGTGDAGAGQTRASKALTFQGLNHVNQRLANVGNQFSLEPPDQGLCAGNGFVMESVNTVMRIFDTAGNPLSGVQDLNTFLGYPAQVDRQTTGNVGPFVTDPSCYYDPSTRRWFHVVLTLEVDPPSGAFLGPNHLDVSVSNSADPTGTWTIYRVPVQDDGTQGTPDHRCTDAGNQSGNGTGFGPCIGDYPHLGLDANGFYVTTNEYSLFDPEFHGAQVYAFSKRALESGAAAVAVTQIDTHGMDKGNSGFTLAPSTSPSAGDEQGNNGAEYFLSSNGADEAHGDGVAVGPRTSNNILAWTLSNTQSLNRRNPDIELRHSVLRVDRYSNPPASDQKAGSTPLAECLNDSACATLLLRHPNPYVPPQCPGNGKPAALCGPEVEYALDSNDSRMLQVTLAAGKLWGALDTKLNGKAGIEWFQVAIGEGRPHLVKDGYLGFGTQNLTYPAIGVTAEGKGVIAFTVLGSNFYPSAGYATIDSHGTGPVTIASLGAGPADGFSGYKGENRGGIIRPRWGDYGASAIVGNTVWIASEMISQTCSFTAYKASPVGACVQGGVRTRTALANWSTQITKVDIASGEGGDN